jgi:hypothetical protein
MINKDKIYHLIAGALVALCPIYPVVAVIIVAFGKELYDYYNPKHTCDGLDAICTLVGGLVMLSLLGK